MFFFLRSIIVNKLTNHRSNMHMLHQLCVIFSFLFIFKIKLFKIIFFFAYYILFLGERVLCWTRDLNRQNNGFYGDKLVASNGTKVDQSCQFLISFVYHHPTDSIITYLSFIFFFFILS